MCGIAGIWGDAQVERLRSMTDRLRHRGPDDEGTWVDRDAGIGLGQRRLSIIDLEGGHQPIFNETGRIGVVFNGEIYNYRELREELLARGHVLTTHSDTETLVHLYEDLGLDFVEKLRGMFAIAIWDGDARRLILARDRVGKKPLYYSEAGGEFLFASEIKGVAAGFRGGLDLDEQVLADYLAWAEIHAPATIYRQVRSLEPAELVVVSDRRITRRRRYWQLQMLPKVDISPEDAVERIDGLIQESVRLRLRSDVPVGAFLSGGIDSGIITAIAARQHPGKLITVTIGFDDDSFDERPLARLVAERYGTDHHEVLVRPDVINDLPKIAVAYDQPFGGPSAVPSYYVAKAARKFVKVVMNGDGGDEVFAGYRRYVAARLNGWLGWADNTAARPVWGLAGRLMPAPREFRSGYAFLHRFVRGMSLDPAARYLAWSMDLMPESQKRLLCGPNGVVGTSNGCWLDHTLPGGRLIEPYLAEYRSAGPVDRMLAGDFCTILPHELLVKMDIACMAHSLEGRSPLLDHVLIETVARYPERIKLHGRQTKPLLRALAKRYLPQVVQTAPKRGFEVPLVRWLRGDLRPMCEDVILSRDGLLAERFDRAALERMLRDKTGLEPRRWSRWTWSMLMLGLWDRHARARWQPAGTPS